MRLKTNMEFFKKIFTFETQKESIYKHCYNLRLTLEEAEMIYKYYSENVDEFKINSKESFTVDRIVEIIILKLNIVTP